MGNSLTPSCFCSSDHYLNSKCIVNYHFTSGSNMLRLYYTMRKQNPYCKCVLTLDNYRYITIDDLDESMLTHREYYFTTHHDNCVMRKIYFKFLNGDKLPKVLNRLILEYVIDLEDFNL